MSESREPTGFVGKYIFSRDHKVIGIQFILTAMFMALIAGALAVVIRLQLGWPENHIIKPETYLSVVTMHGTLMVFFVVSLSLVSGFGNFLIPLMIGARDMAYPFLNRLSYWVIVLACLLMMTSFHLEGGAAAAGWTASPPLSALKNAVPGSGLGQTFWLLAMGLFIASFTMGGFNYLKTILNHRAKGMLMMRLPLVIWAYLVSTILGLLAFLPVIAAIVMLLLDRHGGTSFFLPAGMIIGDQVLPYKGGTPLLFQRLFWFLGHPEVYVLVLPAIGIAFEVIATFSRRPPFGYRISIWSMLLVAFLSMLSWGQHMFVTGMNPYLGEYFSITTVVVLLPIAVLGLNLVASLWRGQLRLETPMLFALGMISAIGIGGLGGLFLGTAASDIYFHDSYFVVGHLHLMIGTVTFLAIFAGIYYWFPKMFGRMLNSLLGKIHFWLTIIPMFSMFLLMHYQGLGGSLRRVYDPSAYQFTEVTRQLNIPISMFAFTVAGAQAIFLLNFFCSLFAGKKAERNPWESSSLEWSAASPAPHGNWGEQLPVVERGPYEYGTGEGETDFVPQATT